MGDIEPVEPRLRGRLQFLAHDVAHQLVAQPGLDLVHPGAGLLQVAATPGAVVLGGDTEVVLDGIVFGKPLDADDAARMLAQLAGRTHAVLSAVCCCDRAREATRVSVSRVRMARLGAAEIAAYVATGEPLGRAGAYAIQGRAGAFIEHLEGSYSGVMGLPLHETALLLREFGLQPL